jgi:hypothetical protein
MKNKKQPADRKILTLSLTTEQYGRIEKVAKMLCVSPEDMAIALALANLDGWSGTQDWEEFHSCAQDNLERFVDDTGASGYPAGKRVEDFAPSRLQRLAGAVAN